MNAKLVLVARIFLGLVFLFSGLNGFIELTPMPKMHQEGFNLLLALADTHYFLPMVKLLEVCCAAALLSGFFVPLAIALLLPVTVNILLFHLFLDPAGIPAALVMCVILGALAFAYRQHYFGLLSARAKIPST